MNPNQFALSINVVIHRESRTLPVSSEPDAHLSIPRSQWAPPALRSHFLPFARRYAQGDD